VADIVAIHPAQHYLICSKVSYSHLPYLPPSVGIKPPVDRPRPTRATRRNNVPSGLDVRPIIAAPPPHPCPWGKRTRDAAPKIGRRTHSPFS
jgi:hypothetical protein